MVESTMPDIVDSRMVVEWLRRQKLDEIQWGTFPFPPEAYVSLGTVTLRSPPYWLGFTAIMTMITLIITAHMMIHPIRHQHAIICLPCIILASYCSMITPL